MDAATRNREQHETPVSATVYFAISVFFVFVAFVPAQSFAAIDFGDIGNISVSLIYATFFFSSILSPSILANVHPGLAVAIGAAGYVPYVLSIAIQSRALILIGAVTCGLGAGLLWCGNGVIMTALSTQQNRGRRFGVFACINRLNFTGNMLISLLLQANLVSKAHCFFALAGLGSLACVLLAIHAMVVVSPILKVREEVDGEKIKKCDMLKSFRLYGDRKFLSFLVTNLIVYGIMKGWVYVQLTQWAFESSPDGSASFVALLMAVYGMAIVIFNIIFGYMFDRVEANANAKLKLLSVPLLLGAAGATVAFLHQFLPQMPKHALLASAALFGSSTAGSETVGYSITSFFYPEKASAAFAAKLFSETIGQALVSVLPIVLPSAGAQAIFYAVLTCTNCIALIAGILAPAAADSHGKEIPRFTAVDSIVL